MCSKTEQQILSISDTPENIEKAKAHQDEQTLNPY
jgi:hypothetical protein